MRKKNLLLVICLFQAIIAFAQPSTYATLPYTTGFESGTLDANWYTTASSPDGRIQIWETGVLTWAFQTAYSHTGTYWLGLDNSPGGTYVTTQAWMGLNLAGSFEPHLTFWWAEWNDETEPQDGVYFSDNGGSSFTKVLDLNGASYEDLVWNYFDLDIAALASANGLTLTSNFVVKFQQYDNYYFAGGNDGFLFDDISVTNSCIGVSDPMITCPGNIDVDNDSGLCGATVNFSVTGTDDCGSPELTEANDYASGDFFPIGTTTLNWTATDNQEGTATCSFTITVNDTGSPTAVCQNITLNLANPGSTSLQASLVDGGSSTLCGTFSLSVDPNEFTCGDLGANTVTLTVTDDSNNLTDECTATVTVADPDSYCCQGPSAVCQNITVQLDANGNASITAADVDGGSTAECGLLDLEVSTTDFTCSDIGQNPVTLTITDENEAFDNCMAIVTVEDNVLPTALCQNVTVQLDANGNGTTTAAAVDDGSYDACGILNISLSQTSFSCSDVGNVPIVLTVTDNNENTATCPATVTVEDNVSPIARCKNVSVQLDETGFGSTTAAAVDSSATFDACGIASLSLSQTDFDCSEVGTNIEVLTVTDNNGNSSTCNAIITVEDNAPPTAVCQNFTLNLTSAGSTTLAAASLDGGSSTACGTFSLSVAPNSFTCDELGPQLVTLTVTDDSNNQTDNCTATVTVADPQSFCCGPPAAVCQNITVQLDANGEASITAADVDGGSTADCGLLSLTVTPTDFICDDQGANTVTLTITDINDLSDECTATVTVEDNVAPVITECEGTFLVFNGEEEFSASTGIDFSATDACGLASTTYTPAIITCDQLGLNVPVTVTVTDNNGKASTCITTVKVDGLPCGFMDFEEDGIGCEDSNEVSYDAPSESFTLESNGCFTTNFTQDDAAYVKAELCGDGEIIAHVTSINPLGQGWAGITMRESEAPGAKKVELLVNLGNLMRRAIRTTTNGYASPAQFFRPGATWLKLVRTGNQFLGYASSNGLTWQLVMAVNVPMNTCIQAGLMMTNYSGNGTVTGTFDHVEVNGSGNLGISTPDLNAGATEGLHFDAVDFSIFPNPAQAEIQLDLINYYGQQAKVEILNQLGQSILQRQLDEVSSSPEKFDVTSLRSGTYFIRVTTDSGDKVKRFLIIR